MSMASTPRAHTMGTVTCSWRESMCTTMRPQVGQRGTCGSGRGWGAGRGLRRNSMLVPGTLPSCPPSASLQEEIMYPEPCWWTWSLAPWTQSAPAPLARSFGLTTLCLVSPGQKAQPGKPPSFLSLPNAWQNFSTQHQRHNGNHGVPQPSGGVRAVSIVMRNASDTVDKGG